MLHLILISLDLADLQHEYSTAFIFFFLVPTFSKTCEETAQIQTNVWPIECSKATPQKETTLAIEGFFKGEIQRGIFMFSQKNSKKIPFNTLFFNSCLGPRC